jgi:hypothetical protein
MSEGYAYTTISTDPGEPARIGVSVYLDEQASITVVGRHTGRPHLSVSLGEVSVRFGMTPDAVTAEDARMARSLADQAADSLSKLAREELKRGGKRTPGAKRSGTQRARNRKQAS